MIMTIQPSNTTSFNPRSRGASDRSIFRTSLLSPRFQSTLARGERLFILLLALFRKQFQSTLARGERPGKPAEGGNAMKVSIHARAGRATATERYNACL